MADDIRYPYHFVNNNVTLVRYQVAQSREEGMAIGMVAVHIHPDNILGNVYLCDVNETEPGPAPLLQFHHPYIPSMGSLADSFHLQSICSTERTDW